MNDLVLHAGAILVAAASLPGSLALGALSLAALWPGQRTSGRDAACTERIAIVVPAHNERQSIGRTLDNLLAAARADGRSDVWVIADNCDDDTAQRAETAGARVIVRENALQHPNLPDLFAER